MMFQLAGLVHRGLRTALLPNELLKRSHSQAGGARRPAHRPRQDRPLRGRPDADRLPALEDVHAAAPQQPRCGRASCPGARPPPARSEPMVDAGAAGRAGGRGGRAAGGAPCCASQGDYQVFIAEARQIPAMLQEIGRLREITFREVSEGTGRGAGPRRLRRGLPAPVHVEPGQDRAGGQLPPGPGGRAAGATGADAASTPAACSSSRPASCERLGPALELGRSFMRAEYQRKPTSLALLWRGIGEYLVRNPHYKILFGPVSISRDYQGLSRPADGRVPGEPPRRPGAGRAGQGQEPARASGWTRTSGRCWNRWSRTSTTSRRWCRRSRTTTRGCRCCCEHYLRLNARLLSFNVDPAFGHCIDGLIVVDLRTTDPKILKRFMGEEGHAASPPRRERTGGRAHAGCCCGGCCARRATGGRSSTASGRRSPTGRRHRTCPAAGSTTTRPRPLTRAGRSPIRCGPGPACSRAPAPGCWGCRWGAWWRWTGWPAFRRRSPAASSSAAAPAAWARCWGAAGRAGRWGWCGRRWPDRRSAGSAWCSPSPASGPSWRRRRCRCGWSWPSSTRCGWPARPGCWRRPPASACRRPSTGGRRWCWRAAGTAWSIPRCSRALAQAVGGVFQEHPAAGHDLPLDAPDWVIERVVRLAGGQAVSVGPPEKQTGAPLAERARRSD